MAETLRCYKLKVEGAHCADPVLDLWMFLTAAIGAFRNGVKSGLFDYKEVFQQHIFAAVQALYTEEITELVPSFDADNPEHRSKLETIIEDGLKRIIRKFQKEIS